MPVAVAGGHAFASVSAGLSFSCGLTTAGAALCWGFNGFGQLGDGTRADSPVPVAVAGGHAFTLPERGRLSHLRGYHGRSSPVLGVQRRRRARQRDEHEQQRPSGRRWAVGKRIDLCGIVLSGKAVSAHADTHALGI